jgi:hypothetical protein
MTQILTKRTSESIRYTLECARLFDPGETITTVVSLAADQGGMVIGGPIINPATFTDPYGRIVPMNTAIQAQISGGVIPPGSTSVLCTLRAKFFTSASPNQREATVLLRLQDQVP